jgi:murein DD-endopeptidase MepM/ murein hydrolase activator NlpD
MTDSNVEQASFTDLSGKIKTLTDKIATDKQAQETFKTEHQTTWNNYQALLKDFRSNQNQLFLMMIYKDITIHEDVSVYLKTDEEQVAYEKLRDELVIDNSLTRYLPKFGTQTISEVSARYTLMKNKLDRFVTENANFLQQLKQMEENLSKENDELKQLNEQMKNYPKIDELLKLESYRKELRKNFQYPLAKDSVISGFGARPSPIAGLDNFHNGTDFIADMDTIVYASMPGVVYETGQTSINGNYVMIRHANGYLSYYGHLSKINVKKGQIVDVAEQIAKSGSTGAATGPHLHFTLMKKEWSDYVDPMSALPKEENVNQLLDKNVLAKKLEAITEKQMDDTRDVLLKVEIPEER